MDDRRIAKNVWEERAALLTIAAEIGQSPDGLWLATKAGVVGTGLTRTEAVRDLADKVWVAFSRSPRR